VTSGRENASQIKWRIRHRVSGRNIHYVTSTIGGLMIGYEDLTWNGNELRHRGRTLATIEPDAEWPNLWRVRRPDGDLTDMVNLTRAKDAARCLALGILNTREKRAVSPRIRYFERAVSAAIPST
jgi:hypothetical protein